MLAVGLAVIIDNQPFDKLGKASLAAYIAGGTHILQSGVVMTIEDRRHKRYWTHGKPREKPYIWRDRATGATEAFKTRKEAETYQDQYNVDKRSARLGNPTTRKDLQRYTVEEIIRGYMSEGLKEITVNEEFEDIEEVFEEDGTGLPYNVYMTLGKFLREHKDICSKTLQAFDDTVAEQYVKTRGKELTQHGKRVTPRAVRWEISHIQLAWKWAKGLPNLKQLPNPWKEVRVIGSTKKRRPRGLREGELERLIQACDKCLVSNRYYLPLAVYLFIETGMRRQELVKLTWEDINFDLKIITIIKDKTAWKKHEDDAGRVIALPVFAELLLWHLKTALLHDGRLPSPNGTFIGKSDLSDRIFWSVNPLTPMTEQALTQAFSDVKRRANLQHVTFMSTLRTTARTRFMKALRDLDQVQIMMGHEGDKSTGKRYYQDDLAALPDIREKLERHAFEGKTAYEKVKEDLTKLAIEGLKEGLSKEAAFESAWSRANQALILQFRVSVEEAIRTSPPS